MPGGGRRLEQGKTWTMNQPAGTTNGQIWARTGCNFDSAGRGECKTGDCGRVLECHASSQHPATLVEYTLNQNINLDFYDISLVVVEGFNMPMEFSPTSSGCRGITCTADINGQCPNELRTPGRGSCQTGDCGGLLQCQAFGQPPNTLAEYALSQFNNLDFFDISLVDGFNVPMDFSPTSGGCTRGIKCTADINGQCPNELRAPGGCNNPCTVFKTDQYCCNSGSCGPTLLSRFFKERCPDAYSYPKDDQTSTFTCPGGTNYRVVFCPPDIPSGMTDQLLLV
ncbi:hypothetical protein RHGRI_020034 [Rhododendron griersonianum]|uniref:Thaumatin-like protein n=1 Tax=Rhododendron griersonianum TaxID=479676 RepID=A0AAV6JET0_9ERIC|nr:hypothetical protein RHGRI_020034 [Rhododendron griersonianum]